MHNVSKMFVLEWPFGFDPQCWVVQELMKEIYTTRMVHSDLDSSGENENNEKSNTNRPKRSSC